MGAPLATAEALAALFPAYQGRGGALTPSAPAAQREARRYLRAAYGDGAYQAAYDDPAALPVLQEAECLLCLAIATERNGLRLDDGGGAVASFGAEGHRVDGMLARDAEHHTENLRAQAVAALEEAAKAAGAADTDGDGVDEPIRPATYVL